MEKYALIVGAGAGLSSSLAFQCRNSGMHVALAARDIGKLKSISEKTGASLHTVSYTHLTLPTKCWV